MNSVALTSFQPVRLTSGRSEKKKQNFKKLESFEDLLSSSEIIDAEFEEITESKSQKQEAPGSSFWHPYKAVYVDYYA